MKRKSNLFRGQKKEKLFLKLLLYGQKKSNSGQELCNVDTLEIPSIRLASENHKCYLSTCATLNVNTFYSNIL